MLKKENFSYIAQIQFNTLQLRFMPNIGMLKIIILHTKMQNYNFLACFKLEFRGVFWRPIDQDQVLTTWSEGRQNSLVLNLLLCDVTALQASKSDINIL